MFFLTCSFFYPPPTSFFALHIRMVLANSAVQSSLLLTFSSFVGSSSTLIGLIAIQARFHLSPLLPLGRYFSCWGRDAFTIGPIPLHHAAIFGVSCVEVSARVLIIFFLLLPFGLSFFGFALFRAISIPTQLPRLCPLLFAKTVWHLTILSVRPGCRPGCGS